MRGRAPSKHDMLRMQEATALLTAYDDAAKSDEFTLFRQMLKEADPALLENMTQLAWLIMRSIDRATEHSTEEILQYYGQMFAEKSL